MQEYERFAGTCWDIQEYVKIRRKARICRSIAEYAGICMNMKAGICRNIQEYAGICKNISEYAGACGNM